MCAGDAEGTEDAAVRGETSTLEEVLTSMRDKLTLVIESPANKNWKWEYLYRTTSSSNNSSLLCSSNLLRYTSTRLSLHNKDREFRVL